MNNRKYLMIIKGICLIFLICLSILPFFESRGLVINDTIPKIRFYDRNKFLWKYDLDQYDGGDESFIPIREGYAFAGWYSDKNLTTKVNFSKIKGNTNVYAGWYKIVEDVTNQKEKDIGNYIKYSDYTIQDAVEVEDTDDATNRILHLEIDDNSTYFITFKMDNRFRIGLKDKIEEWSNTAVSEPYIDPRDTNSDISINEYVYKTIETGNYTDLLIYYYSSKGTRSFTDIKNTFRIYKIENDNIIENNQKINGIDYQIIDGNYQVYYVNSNQNAVFRSNGNVSNLDFVEVDGNNVASSSYTLESGSTIVTLKKDFINSLEMNSEHIFNLVYKDGGEATGIFFVKGEESENSSDTNLVATSLGIGGGGALFRPSISSLDANQMITIPDMGGLYISHDKGLSWQRENLHGRVYSAVYDPNIEGLLYAGGSGLYRSFDNGDNFELIFPKEEDIQEIRVIEQSTVQYIVTKNDDYPYRKRIKDIVIDPDDSNHLLILSYGSSEGIVFESVDGGNYFNEVFRFQVSPSSTMEDYGLPYIFFKKESNEVYAFTDEKIWGYNLDTREKVYESNSDIVDVTSVFENGQTYFIIIENSDINANAKTIVYYTNDFVNKVDITDTIIEAHLPSFTHSTYGYTTYKYEFSHVAATSLNNIYITNNTHADTGTFPNLIDNILRFHNNQGEFVYEGSPVCYLKTFSWNVWGTAASGIAINPNNENEYIFTYWGGVFHSPDGVNVYQRLTNLTEGEYQSSSGRYVTTGIDEQTTYGVREDPYHPGVLLLLNTDFGMIRSENNGESWYLSNNGIPDRWTYNSYDAHFDKNRENVVYSLWSSRHDVPYKIDNETNRAGGFAISYDGGVTWNGEYSSGIPANAIPDKMSVVYHENSEEVTIYVATFNYGFYVSMDSGKTFVSMNEGLEPVNYRDEDGYRYIFAADIEAKDGHVFGLVANNTVNNVTTNGKVYEYINGTWVNIPLPDNYTNPRDIYYKDGTLYISCSSRLKWDNLNGNKGNLYGGGVLAYKDGETTQIFDEGVSITSVQIDSKDTLFMADIEGNIYRKEKDSEIKTIYKNYHYLSDNIELSNDENRLYLSSYGGGLLRLEGLKSYYSDDNSNPVDSNNDDDNNQSTTNDNTSNTQEEIETSPKTVDNIHLYAWLMIITGIGVVMVIFKMRKNTI